MWSLRLCNTLQVNLPLNYAVVVASWRAAWDQLRVHTGMDLSEINSIHTVNSHLCDFYEMYRESLVKFSDHTCESAHQSLFRTLARTNNWVKDYESEAHGRKLYRGVLTHNCYVMDAMRISLIGPAQF